MCSSFGRLFNQRDQLSCDKAIETQTEIKNQCNTVEGINVIYLVIFSK